jgi:hypothetical protein
MAASVILVVVLPGNYRFQKLIAVSKEASVVSSYKLSFCKSTHKCF